MDLQQIKYFLAVVDCGTFLAAAKQVYVSQPTLSAGIKKLEESLGVTLFDRGSRSAALTVAGRQFLPVARQAYNQLQSVKANLSRQPEKIVLGVLNNIHMDYVAQIVATQRLSHPHVLIELVVDSDDVLTRKLQSGQLDLILVNSDTAATGFQPLIREELGVVVPLDHPLVNRGKVSLGVLSEQPFIERVNCSFWQRVDREFKAQGVKPKVVMQAQSDESVLALVAANLGLSIITQRETPYRVKFIPLQDVAIDRCLGICKREGDVAEHVAHFYRTVVGSYRL